MWACDLIASPNETRRPLRFSFHSPDYLLWWQLECLCIIKRLVHANVIVLVGRLRRLGSRHTGRAPSSSRRRLCSLGRGRQIERCRVSADDGRHVKEEYTWNSRLAKSKRVKRWDAICSTRICPLGLVWNSRETWQMTREKHVQAKGRTFQIGSKNLLKLNYIN